MNKGLFITFEGGEGSGKTTVCHYVYKQLLDAGYDVIHTREPGGSNIAEQIRNVILRVDTTGMDCRTEALLFAASRRQHLVEKVLPALEAGKIVICDRFVDSSLVYQGYARGIGIDEVMSINQFAINNCMPDLTLYLDVTPETGLFRIQTRNDLNRLDIESINFHHKVYEGYRIICAKYPERISVIDAEKPLDEVCAAALAAVMEAVEKNV